MIPLIFGKTKSSAILLFLIVLDQASKSLADQTIPVVCNRGSAFGLPIGNVYVSAGLLSIVAFIFLKNRKTGYNLPLALILGGGFSNFIDRIFSVNCRKYREAFIDQFLG